jgi:sugar (pentulose or hexulose) kinase
MADVFNAEVVTLKVAEGAAYGAALQAMWCWRRERGETISIGDITDRFVKVNTRETAQPNEKHVATYGALQTLQDKTATSLKKVFTDHRSITTG